MQGETNLRKTLTIYQLIDTCTQMTGNKIGSVNLTLGEVITVDFPTIALANEDVEICSAIIRFQQVHLSDAGSCFGGQTDLE